MLPRDEDSPPPRPTVELQPQWADGRWAVGGWGGEPPQATPGCTREVVCSALCSLSPTFVSVGLFIDLLVFFIYDGYTPVSEILLQRGLRSVLSSSSVFFYECCPV